MTTGTMKRATALAAAAALTGCAAGGLGGFGLDVVSRVYQDPTYDSFDVTRAAAGGAPVWVIGAPNGDAAGVAERLRLPGWFPQQSFRATPNPGGGIGDGSIFVLQLNAGVGVTGAQLCKGGASEGGPVGAAHLVLCNDGEVIAEGRLESESLVDPTSAAAEGPFRQLTRAVFPPELRDGDDDDDGSPNRPG